VDCAGAARTVAVAEWQRIQRGQATFEMSLALGNPGLIPQSPVNVSGFKAEIDGMDWIAAKVSHNMSDGGFTSRIELETRTEEVEVEHEDEVDRDPGITGVIAKWRDIVTKKNGQELEPTTGARKHKKPLAGANTNPKTLERLYANRQSAQRAADREWAKILERRQIISENNTP
jgi:phage protein D